MTSILSLNPSLVNTLDAACRLTPFRHGSGGDAEGLPLTAEKAASQAGDSVMGIPDSFNSPSFPYGVPALLNNCINNNSKMLLLKNGFISDEEIVSKYDNMRKKMNGKRSPLMGNDAGEVVTFKARSRWNSEFDYGGYVGRKLLKEVEGLKKCSHLILTFDPKKVDLYIPDWWCYGDREFLAVAVGFYVSEFIRQLRVYKKKKGEPWNYVCWVMEFHETGYVHVHMIFYGSWIAPLNVLTALWCYSEANGVRLAKRNNGICSGTAVASYLTHYLAKDLNRIGENKLKRCAAFLWFFRRRLFNTRHMRKADDGSTTWGISQKEYKKKWFLYKNDCELPEVSKTDDALVDFGYRPSDMFLAWKAEHDALNKKLIDA